MGRPGSSEAIQGRIQGMREAKAAFQAMPEAFRDRSNAATELTVREIARHAQLFIERSPSVETRSLLKAIGWSMNYKNGRGRAGIMNVSTMVRTSANFSKGVIAGRHVKVRGIIIAGKGGSSLKSEGSKVINPRRYAHLVEFKHKQRGGGTFAGEPFMRPAAATQPQAYLDRMRAAGKQVEGDLANIGMRTL